MSTFKRYLVSMDIFSYSPSFFTNGQEKHKTGLGAFLNFAILAVYISGVILFSQDIYQKTNPEVIRSSAIDKNPSTFNVNPQDFSFAFALSDPDTYMAYRNESIYFPEFFAISLENGVLAERRKIRTEPCSLQNFENLDPTIFEAGFPFSNYYCIAKDEKISLAGVLTSKQFKYLQIQVKMCNETNNPGSKCSPQEEIDRKLNGVTAYFNYINKYYTPSDYKEPVKSYFKQYFTTVSSKTFTGIITTLKKISVIDDVGWLVEDYKDQTYLGVDELTKQIDFRSVGHFLEFICLFSENQDVLQRKYKKVQTAMAEMGGFLALLKFILGGLSVFYSENKFFLKLIDFFFFVSLKNFKKGSKVIHVGVADSAGINQEKRDSSVRSLNYMTKPKAKINKLTLNESPKDDPSEFLDSREAVEMIKNILDLKEFLLMVKDIKLLKLLLFTPGDYLIYERIVNSKKSSRVLFSNMNNCFTVAGKNIDIDSETNEKLKLICANIGV